MYSSMHVFIQISSYYNLRNKLSVAHDHAVVWKPFLAFLCTTLRYLIRPVPVVFLLIALTDQLYFLIFEAGYPHDEQVVFCLWKDLLPQRLQSV